MSGINKAIVLGHLGKDPEIRTTQDGRKIASMSIATSSSWRDKASGERKEKTTWHRIVIFNEGLAKVAEQYLKKGSKVYVEGEMQTRKWDDNGVDRYITEVVLGPFHSQLVLLDKREGGAPAAESQEDYGTTSSGPASGPASSSGHKPRHDMDDEIPF